MVVQLYRRTRGEFWYLLPIGDVALDPMQILISHAGRLEVERCLQAVLVANNIHHTVLLDP